VPFVSLKDVAARTGVGLDQGLVEAADWSPGGGYQATLRVLERGRPERVLLPVRLVVRASCGGGSVDG
jgi:DNA-binding LacI/PurR family transcriptional regulator